MLCARSQRAGLRGGGAADGGARHCRQFHRVFDRQPVRPAPAAGRRPSHASELHSTHQGDQCCNNFSWPLYLDVRDQAHSFSGVAGYYELVPASVGGNGEPGTGMGAGRNRELLRSGATRDDARPRLRPGRGKRSRGRAGAPPVAESFRRRSGDRGQNRYALRPAIHGGWGGARSFRGLDLILDCQFWVPLGNLDELLPNTGNRVSRSYHWVNRLAACGPA